MVDKLENVGSYGDMLSQINIEQFEILLLPKSGNIGIINAQKAIANLSILVDRAKSALENEYFIEFISLKIQYIEFFLKIFWVTKNPSNAVLDENDRKYFGTIIYDCEVFGFDKNIISNIKDFNDSRIKAIHKYLMGGTTEEELKIISLTHSKLGNEIYEYVIKECGEIINDFSSIPQDVGTIFVARPKLTE